MRRSFAALVVGTLLLAACSSSSASGSKELTVFAASSLTGAFTQIGKNFQAANPGTKVVFNFGPSDGLAGSIRSEGTADVFASASGSWMDAVAKGPGVTDRADFARNRLVVIVPAKNPAGIRAFADVAKPGVKLVLAAPGVPVGDYARQSLKAAHLLTAAESNVVSNEEDDASVVAKVVSGDADAAIVYASDVTPAVSSSVKPIAVPDAVNVIATYPIAVVNQTSEASLARSFVSYVTGPKGQVTLAGYGFLPPR